MMYSEDKRIDQIQKIINKLIAGDLNVEVEITGSNDEIDNILLSLKTLTDELVKFADITQNQIKELEQRMDVEITKAKSEIISMLQNDLDKRQLAALIEKLKDSSSLN